MKRRCFVGATRTTSRRSAPSVERVRHKMVSLENPVDAGAWTSKTTSPWSVLVANHLVSSLATWSGSRWSMSGTGPEYSEAAWWWTDPDSVAGTCSS